jgi:hypothetical protein
LSLSWASSIQSTPLQPISFIHVLILSHLCLGLPIGLFPSCFPVSVHRIWAGHVWNDTVVQMSLGFFRSDSRLEIFPGGHLRHLQLINCYAVPPSFSYLGITLLLLFFDGLDAFWVVLIYWVVIKMNILRSPCFRNHN